MPTTISTKIQDSMRSRARDIVARSREFMGLTQTEYGALVGVSQGEISRIEAGKVEPSAWLIMYLLHKFPDLRQLLDPALGNQLLRDEVLVELPNMSGDALKATLLIARLAREKQLKVSLQPAPIAKPT